MLSSRQRATLAADAPATALLEPGGHSLHMLESAAPREELKRPAPHSTHPSASSLAPELALPWVPAGHGWRLGPPAHQLPGSHSCCALAVVFNGSLSASWPWYAPVCVVKKPGSTSVGWGEPVGQ